jgi:hypothetical protein
VGRSIEWGNVASWASALLTSGSLALAFLILIKDRRKAEREQAALVSAIYDHPADVVRVFNGSDQAIYDVFVFPHNRLFFVPAGDRYWEKVGWSEWKGNVGSLAPRSERQYAYPRDRLPGKTPTVVDVAFVDSFGRAWSRSASGRLTGGRSLDDVVPALDRDGLVVRSLPKRIVHGLTRRTVKTAKSTKD